MKVSLIVAVADNGVIGRGNDLPWRLPADLKRFKELTMGHHLLVGRRTFDAIGRALPGRRMVVISRRSRLELPEGVRLAGSVEEAIEMAQAAGDDEAFVAGGGEIYRQALPRADRLYLTRIHTRFAGDTHFPEIDESQWRLMSRQDHEPDSKNPHAYSYLVYERRPD